MGRNDKIFISFIAIFLIICLILQQWIIHNTPSKEDTLDRIERKIDSLSTKKDSIRIVIDTIDREIIRNEKYHEKIINNIVNMSDSETDSFTRQYIYDFATSRGINIR